MKNEGLIQVYTGDGKGKTTSAVGLACRAIAHKFKIYYIHFFKDPQRWKYGEIKTLKKLGVKVRGFARKHPHFYKDANVSEIRQECLKGLEFIKKILKEKKYDIVILDEINICLRDGFLKEEEILELIELKPKNLELILTGRGVTEKIIQKADLVSEFKKIKHPYEKGIKSRVGIEF